MAALAAGLTPSGLSAAVVAADKVATDAAEAEHQPPPAGAASGAGAGAGAGAAVGGDPVDRARLARTEQFAPLPAARPLADVAALDLTTPVLAAVDAAAEALATPLHPGLAPPDAAGDASVAAVSVSRAAVAASALAAVAGFMYTDTLPVSALLPPASLGAPAHTAKPSEAAAWAHARVVAAALAPLAGDLGLPRLRQLALRVFDALSSAKPAPAASPAEPGLASSGIVPVPSGGAASEGEAVAGLVGASRPPAWQTAAASATGLEDPDDVTRPWGLRSALGVLVAAAELRQRQGRIRAAFNEAMLDSMALKAIDADGVGFHGAVLAAARGGRGRPGEDALAPGAADAEALAGAAGAAGQPVDGAAAGGDGSAASDASDDDGGDGDGDDSDGDGQGRSRLSRQADTLPPDAATLIARGRLALRRRANVVEALFLSGLAPQDARDGAWAAVAAAEEDEDLAAAAASDKALGANETRRTWTSRVEKHRAAVARGDAPGVHAAQNQAGATKLLASTEAAVAVVSSSVKRNLGWWERWEGDEDEAVSASASAPVARGASSWQFSLARLCAESYGEGPAWRQSVYDAAMAAGIHVGDAGSERSSDQSSVEGDAAAAPVGSPAGPRGPGSGAKRRTRNTTRKTRVRLAMAQARRADEEAQLRRRRRAEAMAKALEVLRGDCRVVAPDGRAWALHAYLLRSRSALLADVVGPSPVARAEPGALPFRLPGHDGESGAEALTWLPGPAMGRVARDALRRGAIPAAADAGAALALGRLGAAARAGPRAGPALVRRASHDGFSDADSSSSEEEEEEEEEGPGARASGASEADDCLADPASAEGADTAAVGAAIRDAVRDAESAGAPAGSSGGDASRASAADAALAALRLRAASGPARGAHRRVHREPALAAAAWRLPGMLSQRATDSLVSHVYSGSCQVSGSTVMRLAAAARQLGLPLLLARCEQHLLLRCRDAAAAADMHLAAGELGLPRLSAFASVTRAAAARVATSSGAWEDAAVVTGSAAAGPPSAPGRGGTASRRAGARTLTDIASSHAHGHAAATGAGAVPESPIIGMAGMEMPDVPDFTLDGGGGLETVPAGHSRGDGDDTASVASSSRTGGSRGHGVALGAAGPGRRGTSDPTTAAAGAGSVSAPVQRAAWGTGARLASRSGSAWAGAGGSAATPRLGGGRPAAAGAPAALSLAQQIERAKAAEHRRRGDERMAQWVHRSGAGWAAGLAQAGSPPAPAAAPASRVAPPRVPAAAAAPATAARGGPEEESDSDISDEDDDPFP
ncbi:hypothetical protein FNF31_00458 [Cafeteria roenbergensis]|uniref:Uncharacterized protein n=1 Tax=Cafeteria roenbergensis TaxID=33653 RepID=A0A5A8DTH4_CAFRO|nr:hypothetical protein FNF31_00458 [Cafeteria roenbergensis]